MFINIREARYLELEEIKRNDTHVWFRIKSQSNRRENFGGFLCKTVAYSARSFCSRPDGWILASSCYPEVQEKNKRLYCRGNTFHKDDLSLKVKISSYIEIQQAVQDYNQFYKQTPIEVLVKTKYMYFRSKRNNVLNKKFYYQALNDNINYFTEIDDLI